MSSRYLPTSLLLLGLSGAILAGVTASYGDASAKRQCGQTGAGNNADFFAASSPSSKTLLSNPSDLVQEHDHRVSFHERKFPSRRASVGIATDFAIVPTIIGGSKALPNQLCWNAVVFLTAGELTGICGGTIIGARTILTLASCLFDNSNAAIPPQNVTVMLGALDSNPNITAGGCAETYHASRLSVNPAFNLIDVDRENIAIITLERAIDFAYKPCACLACLDDLSPKVGDVCIVSGVGGDQLNNDTNAARPLKWVRQPVLEQSQGRCFWQVDTNGTVTNNFSSSICAGGVVGEDFCYGGDPGGPLVCLDQNKAFYAAGIALDGTLQCAIGVGSQYTKIQNYLQWIRYAALPEDKL
ncbi:hypothetical protein BV898_19224 [Hypsibius exemplaris]|uniref:Peptidase S1 domain-containing protein n=1 Tax=Hypsibius exemplaris TaxID=2072580 RepID=A0A9X6RP81_HYPEX|nr:hypothetical protein BV898_19224 [Hypsibius exemplaris]